MFGLITVALVALACIGIILLGLFTYQSNPKSITSRLFFIFSLTLALYIAANYLATTQTVDALSLFWIRIVMGIALLINIFYFFLVCEFPNVLRSLPKKAYYIIGLLTLCLVLLSQTPAIFASVLPGTNQPVPGMGMPLFLLHTVIFLGGGVLTLVRKFRRADGIIKNQLRFFILATAFMFFAILLTNVFFVLVLKTYRICWVAPNIYHDFCRAYKLFDYAPQVFRHSLYCGAFCGIHHCSNNSYLDVFAEYILGWHIYYWLSNYAGEHGSIGVLCIYYCNFLSAASAYH
ncbi:MAG: hypothetical protein UZ22_OP11002000879 [Microgenomates bacterium OLB23]|nr:MAG: hypothetical protein UZ22_OP11002000879 [Microgenomates bacterium OLB23]